MLYFRPVHLATVYGHVNNEDLTHFYMISTDGGSRMEYCVLKHKRREKEKLKNVLWPHFKMASEIDKANERPPALDDLVWWKVEVMNE